MTCSGEILLADGRWEACAFKRLPFTEPQEQIKARSELQALLLAQDMPHIVQGLAAFEETVCKDADSKKRYMWVAMRSLARLLLFRAQFAETHVCMAIAESSL